MSVFLQLVLGKGDQRYSMLSRKSTQEVENPDFRTIVRRVRPPIRKKEDLHVFPSVEATSIPMAPHFPSKKSRTANRFALCFAE